MELCHCQCCFSDLHLTISAQSPSPGLAATLSPNGGEGVNSNHCFPLAPIGGIGGEGQG